MHRVQMRFERIFDQWRVSFVNLSSREMLREFTFADGFKVEQMAERAGALTDLASKQGLENGLRNGNGGVVLHLTAEQYSALRLEAKQRN